MSFRVLIDPSSHHLLNLGDVAMLQVCVTRLRETWPGARVDVVTEAPERLRRYSQAATPVPARGRYALLANGGPPGRLRGRSLRRDPDVRAYLEALDAADLFVMSGRGGLTDAFPEESVAMLEELALAHDMGTRTALMGQGVGPLTDAAALRRAAEVLPEVDLFALREGTAGPGRLAQLGVRGERVLLTGDDTLALVGAGHNGAGAPAGIALSVRVAPYAGVTLADAEQLVNAVGAVGEEVRAPIIPVVVSTHPHEHDSAAVSGIAPGAEPPSTPEEAIELIRGSRVMVTGSYHAAVFALAQGVPAIGVSASPYYDDKFRGLRGMFGDWCELVRLGEPSALERLAELTERFYLSWPEPREELLAAAARQVEASRAAYGRLAELVSAG
jgi:polysaccharide pyruvyl transferase WcaK-like protein